jgi:putative NADH-flavin reductase
MKLAIFGATGRTGNELVAQALAAGHEITALARDPAKLNITDERLRVAQGDALDTQLVDGVIAGQDAVISVLGHTRNSPKDVQTRATEGILDAMRHHGVRRIVTLTGAGVASADDPPSAGATVMKTLLKLISRDVLEDAVRSSDLLRASDRDWVIARVPRLVDGPHTGVYRVGTLQLGPGARISRADAADFLLRAATEDTWLRQLPMISY